MLSPTPIRWLLGLGTLILTLPSTAALPLGHQQQQSSSLSRPAIASDFPDPSIIKVNSTWYAFGTQSLHDHREIRVQLATSTDFETWALTGNDAMGILPPWVNQHNPQIWAPDILARDDGTYILYFSALHTSHAGIHCIGTATSTSILGPFDSNSDTPFACPVDQGGAIDASAFLDPDDGSRYVVYKIDGNALGHGGLCGNTVEPVVSTPIMIQRVAEDWTTPVGEAVQLLDRGEFDGPLVEAPAMMKRDGVYYLFFSSNCYTSALYDTSYATSASPKGGFAKARFPLLVQGFAPGVAGPGHADVVVEGGEVFMAFHAYATYDDVGGRRAMFVRRLDVGDSLVKLQ